MNQDEIIEKIKKALRLARKAGTDGERVAAENAARRMAENNGIALENVTVEDEGVDKTGAGDTGKWTTVTGCEVGFAGVMLWEHFGVKLVTQVSREKGKSRYQYTFFGTRINIEVAKYAFDIMLRESRRAWEEVKTWRGVEGMDKQVFMRGWFCVIHEKLLAHPIRNDAAQFAAEKAKTEKDYEEFKKDIGVKSRKPKMRNEDKIAAANRYNAFEAGMNEAGRVSLNRPCGGTPTVRPEVGETRFLKGGI